MPDDAIEEWRPIQRLDSLYAVSSLGRIRRAVPGRTTRTNRLLRPYLTRRGYMRIGMRNLRGEYVKSHIHQFVAEAFLGSRPTPQHQVNHLDGNKLNNQASNLEWVTPRQNLRHAVAHGLHLPPPVAPERRPRGTANPNVRLTESAVLAIRAARGIVPRRLLAQTHGVGKSTIDQVWSGRTWRHLLDGYLDAG
jgi:hypothetical protein